MYIPRMCRFVGSDLTCDFIIPCLETALYDVEDTVVVVRTNPNPHPFIPQTLTLTLKLNLILTTNLKPTPDANREPLRPLCTP